VSVTGPDRARDNGHVFRRNRHILALIVIVGLALGITLAAYYW
jgi:hypothetical protein